VVEPSFASTFHLLFNQPRRLLAAPVAVFGVTVDVDDDNEDDDEDEDMTSCCTGTVLGEVVGSVVRKDVDEGAMPRVRSTPSKQGVAHRHRMKKGISISKTSLNAARRRRQAQNVRDKWSSCR